MTNKIYYSIPEAAQTIGIGICKLREICKQRDCDFAIKIGTKTLVNIERLTQYLEQKRVL